MKRLFFISAALILFLASAASAIETVHIHDNTDTYYLEDKVSYFKEDRKNVSINSIIRRLNTQSLKTNPGRLHGFIKGKEAYWFLVKLQNNTTGKNTWNVSINWRILDTIDLYSVHYGGSILQYKEIKHYKSGTAVKIKNRPVKHRNYIFPLIFQKDQNVLIAVRATSSLNFAMPLVLLSNETHKHNDYIELIIQGIFFGILLIMIFYNLFIYISIRDSNYLIYVFYVFANLLYQAASTGIGYQYLWPDSTWFETRSTLILGAGTFILAAIFAIDYLNLKKNHTIFFRLGIIIVFAWFFTFISTFFGEPIFSTIFSTPLTLISCVFALYVGIALWSRGLPEARYFTIAWTVMISGTAVFILYLNGALPQNNFTIYSQQAGVIFEVVLLSLGLANRINVMKNSLTNLNENLESIVASRTEELESSMEEIKAINEELVETRDKLWSEMELARKIQTVMLPKDPAVSGYKIKAYMDPADSVGGDYYDILNFINSDWILIGDVSGHGVSAGLVMMMVQSSIHTYLKRFPEVKPSKLLEHVNKTIKDILIRMDENRFMTISAFCIQNGSEITCSGRHEFIFIYRADQKIVETIIPEGIIISLLPYKKKDINITFSLNPNDVLLLYTDGIVEAIDSDKKLFSHEKLKDILQKNGERDLQEIQEKILSELNDYSVDDDVTILTLKKTE